MDKHKSRLEKLEGRADALPRLRRRDPEHMHPLDRRYHEIVGDLSFVPPGHMTPEEAAFVAGNPEVKRSWPSTSTLPPRASTRSPCRDGKAES